MGAETTVYDVIVIGGGINGTSAARELSAAGYRVLLVEQGDLAHGASSRSSRILHCGLRYFETHNPARTFLRHPRQLYGAVRMARAAMQARDELVDLMPERCRPFTMCFPLYAEDNLRGWHLDAGFAILKRLATASTPLDYRRQPADRMGDVPFKADLRDQGDLQSVATYREYIIDWPDRLCVDAALEAEQHGACIQLFTRAHLRDRGQDGTWRVEMVLPNQTQAQACAPVVLNLAGTWIDDVLPRRADAGRLVRGTKGAHITVRLPPRYANYGLAALNRLGMPIYCLPMGGDLFHIGPTETPFEGDARTVTATDADIAFLLDEINHLLPGLRLTAGDVQFTWAGVRPLTFDSNLPMGRRTREIHDLTSQGLPGVLAMTAGPVMSHRSAGRDLRDAVRRRLPLPGAANAIGGATPALQHSVAHELANEPLTRDFRRAVTLEHARDLPGILYTRTGLAWGQHLDRETVEHAASAVADLLAWSPADITAKVDAFMLHQATVFRRGPAAPAC